MNNHTYYPREMFGQTMDFPAEMIFKAAKAQLVIAAADGLSPQELEDCHGIGRLFGASEEMIQEIKKFDYKNAKLADVLLPELRPMAKQFLYFAVKVASADGHYAAAERAHVAEAAKTFGVDTASLKAIEGIVEAELGLRAARIAICSPV